VFLSVLPSSAAEDDVAAARTLSTVCATCAVMVLSRNLPASVTDLARPIGDVAQIVPLPFRGRRAGTDGE
jgi:hypothetical protein